MNYVSQTAANQFTANEQKENLVLIRIILALAISLTSSGTALCTDALARKKAFEASQIQADFEQLYSGLQRAHFDLYARRPKADYDRLYQQMRRDFVRALPLVEVRKRFQRFVAFGRVAHARIDEAGLAYEQFRTQGGKAFPLGIRVVRGRVYVISNLSGDARINLGDEITHIDAQPMSSLLIALWDGLSADNEYMRNTLMEHYFSALLWQSKGGRASFRIILTTDQGKQKRFHLSARSRKQAQAFAKLQPQQFEPDWNAREAKVLPTGIAYLRPGPFYNTDPNATNPWDNTSFLGFIEKAFNQFEVAACNKLLIDLRNNPGGDNSFSDAMVARLVDKPFRFASKFRIRISQETIASNAKRLNDSEAGSITHQLAKAYAASQLGEVIDFELPMAKPSKLKRFTGQVILLINRHSYSNTANVAALAQDLGIGKIVGEETSDLATTLGAMEQFSLPETGITIGYPKAQIIRLNGDLRASGVVPDLAIETPIVPLSTDVVLRQALALFE